jgi:aspartyl protease family protein
MKKLSILILFALPISAFAQVYKCNESGQVVYSASPCASGGMAYRSTAASGASAGSLSVPLDSSGSYSVRGSVNGTPVQFKLDTGANATVLSADAAYQLGVKTCAAVGYAATAGGKTALCRVTISNLEFGSFQFTNIPVAISPAMRGASLIGTDLLSRFRIEQSGGFMNLSR